eukprot:TRINITY_DN242_c0_g1_i15.p4 TRINITY_DN242_c0_g1~~TRINITY_DN242_c0_g1_i15.p4  ORF type:complete len:177 (-),score=31.25 TRINITY_DN242_c0_g1_i15:388-918(-)
MTETTAAASSLRAVLDPPPPTDAHLAGAIASLCALRSLLESRRAVSSRVAQLGAAVEAAGRDTARRVEGVDGRVVEVKLASVLAMEERDQVAHELAALERQLAAAEGGMLARAGGGGCGASRHRKGTRWARLGRMETRMMGRTTKRIWVRGWITKPSLPCGYWPTLSRSCWLPRRT